MADNWVCPQSFSPPAGEGAAVYLNDPSTLKLAEFFRAKGLSALKNEDQHEQWHDDWLKYQAGNKLYATVVSPADYSSLGNHFDLLRYTRFLEVFGYFSAAHGYSLQVSFLGLFAILMGSNTALKKEAVTAIEGGGLLAFGVSEKQHGSDLLANEFTVAPLAPGKFMANGKKYYIGNSEMAAMIAILARKDDGRATHHSRQIPILFALRPQKTRSFGGSRKIRTLGVRSAFVGEFEIKDHPLPEADLIAEGRGAWDAVFGAITLGKFFLGFGSIGICEHALEEAVAHLTGRMLYGKPAIEMPHLRSMTAQAYARLTAMKLYAYRTLDYVHAADANDRRYLLYCAVQKARVSTEGVKVMALLSECIGAKGFESDTYFEMALRDAQLIPGLEGSTHINLAMAAQFIPRYFGQPDAAPKDPPSVAAIQGSVGENPYLMQARTGAINTIGFSNFLKAYRPLATIPGVRAFSRQVKAFELFIRKAQPKHGAKEAIHADVLLGQCLATISYAQLIAENAMCLGIPPDMVTAIFNLLVGDLTAGAIAMATSGCWNASLTKTIQRMVVIPQPVDWSTIQSRAIA